MEIIYQDHILVIGVTKEILSRDWFKLIVKKFVIISVREWNTRLLQVSNILKHRIYNYNQISIKQIIFGMNIFYFMDSGRLCSA